jgi:hypothetical protein
VEASAAHVAEGTSLAGDALNAVHFERARPVAVKDAPPGLDAEALMLMGAAVRAMQMAGALEAILDLAVAYANERVAFGRPIAKFQAVQHNLARLAGETAALRAGSPDAVLTTAFDDAFLEAQPQRLLSEAAEKGGVSPIRCTARSVTIEHILHRYPGARGARRFRLREFGGEPANGRDAAPTSWAVVASR